jgi:hypothetical protein
MKRSFMQKCPFKMNVEGLSAQGVVKVRWLQVDVSCAFVFFHLFPCCGIGCNLWCLARSYKVGWLHPQEVTRRRPSHNMHAFHLLPSVSMFLFSSCFAFFRVLHYFLYNEC